MCEDFKVYCVECGVASGSSKLQVKDKVCGLQYVGFGFRGATC